MVKQSPLSKVKFEMKLSLKILLVIHTFLAFDYTYAIELKTLEYEVIHDEPLYVRPESDRRYSVWTDDPDKVADLLKKFDLPTKNIKLQKGQIVAVFLNDHISEQLTHLTYNKTRGQLFADYADSGIKYHLSGQPGKKYSRLTAVVFSPVVPPSHLGMRRMARHGLSEKL